MSKFCTKCGAQLAPDALFCGKCGTRIVGEQEEIKKAADVDEVNVSKDKSQFEMPIKPIAPVNKKKLAGIFGAVVALILILIVVLVVLKEPFIGKRENNNKENETLSEMVSNEQLVENKINRQIERNDFLITQETLYNVSGEVSDDTKYTYYQTGAYKFMEMTLYAGELTPGHIYINYGEPQTTNVPEWAVTYGNNVGDSNTTDNGYYKVTYDENWRLIKQELYDLNLRNVESTVTIKYDDRGNEIELINQGENYMVTTTYEYDEYNVLISETEVIGTSKTNSSRTYTYNYEFDDNGLPKVKRKYQNNKFQSSTQITRNDKGLIIKEETTDSEGRITIKEYECYLKEDYIKKFYSTSDTMNNLEENGVSKEFSNFNISESKGEAEIQAEELFLELLNGKDEVDYDDPSCDGMISIYKDIDEEANTCYTIIGRGFYGFSSSDCFEVVGNIYYFYRKDEWSGTYYKIEVKEDHILIYYGDSQETCNELCGQIGESDETLKEKHAEEEAKKLFSELLGQYEDIISGETITIRTEEGFGYNSYASYAIEGKGFETLYETWCAEADDGLYHFDLGDTYYIIRVDQSGEVTISSGSDKEDCNKICGSFRIGSLDNKDTNVKSSDKQHNENTGTHTHAWSAWNVSDNSQHYADCKCGEKKFEAHGFDGGKITVEATEIAEGEKVLTCTGCGFSVVETMPKIEHSHGYGNWSNNNDGSTHSRFCSCGDKETESHSFDSGTITTEPTCSSAGAITYTCTVCGATQAESIPPIELPDTMEYDQQRVCYNCGHDDGTEHYVLHRGEKIDTSWTCSSCGTENKGSIEMY